MVVCSPSEDDHMVIETHIVRCYLNEMLCRINLSHFVLLNVPNISRYVFYLIFKINAGKPLPIVINKKPTRSVTFISLMDDIDCFRSYFYKPINGSISFDVIFFIFETPANEPQKPSQEPTEL